MLRKMKPIKNNKVQLQDAFWSERIKLLRDVILPYQWGALNDQISGASKSGCVQNFKIAAGEAEGEYHGYVFQDTDLYKWLEAVGYSLMTKPDPELERTADEAIELIANAQQPDGYLNTYYTVKEPGKRWTNLMHNHELYTAGHFFEGAVAYYEATGKRKVLDIACKFADYMISVFGDEPGQIKGYDGHEEIELALVKLYYATGERKYLELGKYFIDQRGQEPSFFAKECEQRGQSLDSQWIGLNYFQAHSPVRDQKDADGHAVRAMYLYSGIADVAAETGDTALLEACKTLWKSTTQKRMYVTGGIGSIAHGEAFTIDYDLPNDYAYTETCASIGLVFLAHRMLQIEPNGEYADVMERALYNGVLSGMSADGKSYFYVNPLEVWPEACRHRHDKKHVKTVRQGWFGCACCPPNLARLLASLNQYIYSNNDKEVYVHLYIGSEAEAEFAGAKVSISQSSNLPWDGQVKMSISADQPTRFVLALRIPAWSKGAVLKVNGEPVNLETVNGYAKIDRLWSDGDQIELTLPMTVERLHANPNVRVNAGKVSLLHGPIVYCLEEIDNGPIMTNICLSSNAELTVNYEADLLGGVAVISGNAVRADESGWGQALYQPARYDTVPVSIRAVPYFAWCNREPGEMLVWIREC